MQTYKIQQEKIESEKKLEIKIELLKLRHKIHSYRYTELLQAVPKFDLSFLPDKEKKKTSHLVLRINIKLFLHGQKRNLI